MPCRAHRGRQRRRSISSSSSAFPICWRVFFSFIIRFVLVVFGYISGAGGNV